MIVTFGSVAGMLGLIVFCVSILTAAIAILDAIERKIRKE